MIIDVHMTAFMGKDVVRKVNVPDDDLFEIDLEQKRTYEQILNLVFRYGQNEIQPQPMPSVSVGDTAVLWKRYFMCTPVGWKKIKKEEFEAMNELMGMKAYFMEV